MYLCIDNKHPSLSGGTGNQKESNYGYIQSVKKTIDGSEGPRCVLVEGSLLLRRRHILLDVLVILGLIN